MSGQGKLNMNEIGEEPLTDNDNNERDQVNNIFINVVLFVLLNWFPPTILFGPLLEFSFNTNPTWFKKQQLWLSFAKSYRLWKCLIKNIFVYGSALLFSFGLLFKDYDKLITESEDLPSHY